LFLCFRVRPAERLARARQVANSLEPQSWPPILERAPRSASRTDRPSLCGANRAWLAHNAKRAAKNLGRLHKTKVAPAATRKLVEWIQAASEQRKLISPALPAARGERAERSPGPLGYNGARHLIELLFYLQRRSQLGGQNKAKLVY